MGSATDAGSERLLQLSGALASLHEHAARAVGTSGDEPSPGSPADRELSQCAHAEALRGAYHQGLLLREVAADQAWAVARLATPGRDMTRFASSVCARALLEASASSIWLLDPRARPQDRIARSLALRYDGVGQQRKLALAEAKASRLQNDESAAAGFDALVAQLGSRSAHIAVQAASMGFAPITTKTGACTGAGTRKPPFSDLVRDMLGAEADYKLLCAVVHAQHWALVQIGFLRQEASSESAPGRQRSGVELRPHLHPEWIAHVCMVSARAFATCAMAAAALLGSSADRLWTSIADDMQTFGLAQQDVS